MEVGISRPGEMAPIADFLKPDIVVVTFVTANKPNFADAGGDADRKSRHGALLTGGRNGHSQR